MGSPRPHLRLDWARPAHICAGAGLTPPTSAPGLGSPRPHLRRSRAYPARIRTRIGLAPAHICAGTMLTPPTSAQGLRSTHPHLHHRDGARPCSHLRRDWARPRARLCRERDCARPGLRHTSQVCHACRRCGWPTGGTSTSARPTWTGARCRRCPTSAPRLGSPLPTSAPGLRSPPRA
jgi:hypothetical protein